MFETQRMSKDYVLLDFLFDHAVYTWGHQIDFRNEFTEENMEEGRRFVENLLQPLTNKYGPTSIADGFWPEKIRGGHYSASPHRWNGKYGAAVDVVFHDHVNCEKAPIALCHDIDRSSQVFHRMITYAGSEFICLCYRTAGNRDKILEYVRIPGEEAERKNHGMARAKRRQQQTPDARLDWRRSEGEGVGKRGKRLRAHHIRVGRYFVLLDFCRSVVGLRKGFCTVPSIELDRWNLPEVDVAKRFAEILDPMVHQHGRVTVLRGMEPAEMSDDVDAGKHCWTDSEATAHRLVFLVNQEVKADALRNGLLSHNVCVQAHDHSSVEVALEIDAGS